MRAMVLAALLATGGFAQTTFELTPLRAGGRTGSVTVHSGPEGLIIKGKVAGGLPEFARTANEMAAKDHIGIWLASASDPVLPMIGWGNQFGMWNCASENIDAKARELCPAFVEDMEAYRAIFRRLFVRQYQLAPNISVETFATAAYSSIEREYQKPGLDKLILLKPIVAPVFDFMPTTNGYEFTALLPWTALPPVNSLKLDRLRVMVDVFSAHAGATGSQPYSSTAQNRRYGQPSTFPVVTLDPPMMYTITSCGYELSLSDIFHKEYPAWFLPGNTGQVREAFIIQNFATGYQYEPDSLSPTINSTRFFEREVAPGQFVCGPLLARRDKGRLQRTAFPVDDAKLETKLLPDQSLLIKSGPTEATKSPFGSGMCGACPLITFSIYRAFNLGPIERLYELSEVFQNSIPELAAVEVRLSPDWKKFTVYRKFDLPPVRWDSESKCFDGRRYLGCGITEGVPAPKPENSHAGSNQ
ncbi:MAG: hypothetical protein H7039_10250 [Bryobacteraceae bacterium]|nr:hypothetical protein [Bryobacteraceae bacterium]